MNNNDWIKKNDLSWLQTEIMVRDIDSVQTIGNEREEVNREYLEFGKQRTLRSNNRAQAIGAQIHPETDDPVNTSTRFIRLHSSKNVYNFGSHRLEQDGQAVWSQRLTTGGNNDSDGSDSWLNPGRVNQFGYVCFQTRINPALQGVPTSSTNNMRHNTESPFFFRLQIRTTSENTSRYVIILASLNNALILSVTRWWGLSSYSILQSNEHWGNYQNSHMRLSADAREWNNEHSTRQAYVNRTFQINSQHFFVLTWKVINRQLTVLVHFFDLNDTNSRGTLRVTARSNSDDNFATPINRILYTMPRPITNFEMSFSKYVENIDEAFALHNHMELKLPVTFHEPEHCYRPGFGMLYHSDPNMSFPALNYISTRSKINKMATAPVFLETGHFNSLLLFMNDRVDRLVISKSDEGVLLDRNLINSMYNTYLIYPNMTAIVEGNLYFISPEGVMRLSQEGLQNLSKDVIVFRELAELGENEKRFIQYIPCKKQIWFYFGDIGKQDEGQGKFYALVYDLKWGVFYEFYFRRDLVRGYFSDDKCRFIVRQNNQYVVLSYPAKEPCEEKSFVKTKKYFNQSKLKKIRTKSKFDNLKVIRDPRREPVNSESFEHSEGDIYVLDSGFKGDLEFEFDNVKTLEWLELYFKE